MSAKAAIEARLRKIGRPEDSIFKNNEPLIMQWDESLKELSKSIERYYLDNRQTKEEYAEKLEILKEIEKYVTKNIFNKKIHQWKFDVKAVVPFGSSASGLGMKGGDLDMTICLHPGFSPKNKKIKLRTNMILEEILEDIDSGRMLPHREFEDMEHRFRGRIPIVTGIVDDIDLDISISMTEGVSAQYLTCKYIDAYAKYDHRFILLAVFAKAWQKSMKTDRNERFFKKIFPNSCTIVLMVIFFMKRYKLLPPNINKKHAEHLGIDRATWARVRQGENGSFGIPNEDVSKWKESNYCDVSIGTLFMLYLDFYSEIVDFSTQKLDIENGILKEKEASRRTAEIVIVDVVDKHNTAESVVYSRMLQHYMERAKSVIMKTDRKQLLHILMNSPIKDISEYSEKEFKELRERRLLPKRRGRRY
uniref:Polynucleotide adenylyltransferase n=1 Tax=Caenorhabditis tropicalis TaxID=1561998 RepID=A0A1I7TU37_9PELO